MNTAKPHINFPLEAQPGRIYDWSVPYDRDIEGEPGSAPIDPEPVTPYPYDQAGPYDWDVEGVFDDEPEPLASEDAPYDDNALEWQIIRDRLKVSVPILLIGLVGTWLAAKYAADHKHDGYDVQDIPAALPKPVKSKTGSAVKIKFEPHADGLRFGSGVKIGPDLVLTAGHVVNKANPWGQIDCAGSYVSSVLRPDQYEPTHQIISMASSHMDTRDDTRGQDIGLLRVNSDQTFDSLPTADIAKDRPQVGAAAFFINYETDADPHIKHAPYQGLGIGPSVEGTGKYYDHAAEYAGTVISNDGPYIELATSVQGYGPKPGMEIDSYPGSSGGPVFDADGNLIGESVASYTVSENIRQINREYGVKLPYPFLRRITIVQPITPSILRPYIEALPDDPAC